MRFEKRKAMYLIYVEGGVLLLLLIALLISGISKKVSDNGASDNSGYTMRSFSDDDFSAKRTNSEIGSASEAAVLSAASKAAPVDISGGTSDISGSYEDPERDPFDDREDVTDGENGVAASEQPAFSAEVVSKLETMTLEEKLAQMFIVSPETLTSTPGGVIIAGNITKASLQEYPVGGIAYSKVNYRDNDQAIKLISGANDIALERIGINILPFAFGADSNGEGIIALGRSFSPESILDIIALQGDLSVFSNEKAFSITSFPPEPLVSADNCVAVSGLADESLTNDATLPCFFSNEAVRELRRLSADGSLVITTALSADTIPEGTSLSTAVINAINSGVDMVFVPTDFPTVYEAVISALEIKIISEDTIWQAAGRVLQYKQEMLE